MSVPSWGMRKKAPTIYDIAAHAGVSSATVSRVLNGQANVNAELRSQVEAAMQELRFRPNRTAQSLNHHRSQTLGCVLPDITSPYFARLFLAIETCAFERGYSVILGNASNDYDLERTYLHSLAERQVDGLLLLGGRSNLVAPTSAQLQDIQEVAERLPIVSVNGDLPGVEGVYSVNSDERTGMRALLDHLLAAGHTQIAFLGGLEEVTGTQLKLSAYHELMAERGLKVFPEWIQLSGYSVEDGEKALRRVLAQPERPTAALCINDLVAAGVLRAARTVELSVPEDLSVTGFDDVNLAELVTPPLTSVNHNYQHLAQLAVDVLLRAVEGERPPRLSSVPTTLVARGSVTRPHPPLSASSSGESDDQHVQTRPAPLRRRLQP